MQYILNINRRHAYLLAASFTLLLTVILVNAFGTNNPSVFGHSAGEVGGVGPLIVIEAGTEQTIQQAISEIVSLGGGVVFMKAGVYNLSSSVNLSSNVALVGQGSATILQAAANNINLITEQNAGLTENIRLADFTLNSGSSTGIAGIVLTSASGLIEGLNISGMQSNSIQVINSVASGTNPVMHIRRNRIVSTGGLNGISILGTSIATAPTEQLVVGNIIEGTYSDSGINASQFVQVRDNTLSVTNIGINASSDVIAQGNKVRSSASVGQNEAGIVVSNRAQAADNFVSMSGTAPAIEAFNDAHVKGNQVSSTSGIAIEVASDATVIGNRVSSAGEEGILYSTAGGTGNIIGNQIVSWSGAAGTHAAVRVTGGEVLVADNTIEGTTGPGINITGGNAITVTGNYVSPGSNVAIVIDPTGTGLVDSNVVTVSAGTAILAVSDSVTISNNRITNGDIVAGGQATIISGNFLDGTDDINATGQSFLVIDGNRIEGDLDIAGAGGSKVATGNLIGGSLYAAATGECAISGNAVGVTLSVGTCSTINNV